MTLTPADCTIIGAGLLPFITNNTKLRSLELGGFRLSDRFAQLFDSALSGCNTTLQQFELNKCEGMTVDIMEKIVEAVVSHPHIKDLSFNEYDWNDGVAEALGIALSNNNTNLESLSLDGLDYDYQDDRRGSMTEYGVEAVLDFITSSYCSLKKLSFRSNTIGPLGGIALAEALEGNTTLERLDISAAMSPWYGQQALTSQGWSTFFGSLRNCSFRNLDLGGNTIEDDDVASMVEALNSFGSLKTLDLWEAGSITSSGWVAFFDLLAQPGSVLERLKKLELDGRNINDEVMVSVANALVNNASLEEVDWCGSDSVTKRGWSAIETTLCNKTSIETICNSNHTLNRMHHGASAVDKLTGLNAGTNKAEVARQKIIRYYFLEGKGSNLHEIMGMDLEVLPHVLECFCKQEIEVQKDRGSKRSNGKYTIKVGSGFELLYRVARGMPSLFDAEGKVVGGKRKRTTR